MTTRMEGALAALHQGQITFHRFEKTTREDWNKLAGKMFTVYSRKGLPTSITEEDVRQEMLLAAWRAVASYDAQHPKAPKLSTYVVWCACNRAGKWLNRQRKARDARAPSRFPLTMGALGIGAAPGDELGEAEMFDLFASAEPEQEARVDHARAMTVLEGTAETALGRDALRVWVLAGGDVVEAGVDLWFDAVARADHGLRTPKQGIRAVERAVREVQQVLSGQERFS